MTEITVHGTVTADPELRYSSDGEATVILLFSVTVDHVHPSPDTGERAEEAATIHDVAAIGSVAEDAAKTLENGMTVAVTGKLEGVSHLHGDSEQLVCRQRLTAARHRRRRPVSQPSLPPPTPLVRSATPAA